MRRMKGLCATCNKPIYSNEKSREIETHLKARDGSNMNFVIHEKCLDKTLIIIFEEMKYQMQSCEIVINELLNRGVSNGRKKGQAANGKRVCGRRRDTKADY